MNLSANMNQLSYVDPCAKIGQNVTIEPFAIIKGDVEIGDGCWIGSHAVIMDGVRIGSNCKIFPGAVLGGLVSYPLTLVAALGLGLFEAGSAFWASSYKEVLVFLLVLPVLLWRSLVSPHVDGDEE